DFGMPARCDAGCASRDDAHLARACRGDRLESPWLRLAKLTRQLVLQVPMAGPPPVGTVVPRPAWDHHRSRSRVLHRSCGPRLRVRPPGEATTRSQTTALSARKETR